MRTRSASLLIAILTAARLCPAQTVTSQTEPQLLRQAPVLRGALLECDDGATGQFSIRADTNEVIRYQFDAKTSVDRQSRKSGVERLLPGDQVEVFSELAAGSLLRYARTVTVTVARPPLRPAPPVRAPAYRPEEERLLLARGDMQVSGVVASLSSGRMALHTKDDGLRIFRLRQDTRFMSGGSIVAAADLKLNTRVFVRAGRDLFGQVEAYQVVWGLILEPR